MVSTWIASDDGWLAARVHLPETPRARGSVVLVPPVGRELVVATRSWVVLARRLARAGFVVVRHDPRGWGDSTALTCDDPVAAWTQDTDAAIDLAQQLLPGHPTHLVGLRVGASIAAGCTHPAVGQRTLWEPVSGRRFLRGQTALRRLSVHGEPLPHGQEVVGGHFTDAQASALRTLKAPDADHPAVRREDDEAARNLWSGHPSRITLPQESIDAVVTSLGSFDPLPLQAWEPTLTAVHRDGTGEVTEAFVEVGPHQLPGILTRGSGAAAHGVLLCPSGSEPRSGPTGLWATAARELAARGVTTLRMERRGTGDALVEEQAQEPLPYRESAVEDVAQGIDLLAGATGTPVSAVGLSAGGWVVARVAADRALERVVLVNNVGWHVPESRYRKMRTSSTLVQRHLGSRIPTGDEDTDEGPSPEAQCEAQPWTARCKQLLVLVRDEANRLVPTPMRALMGRAGLVMDPMALLEPVRHGRVELWHGSREQELWRSLRGDDRLRALQARGRDVVMVEDERLDHSLLSMQGRVAVVERMVGLWGARPVAAAAAVPVEE